MCDKPTCDCGSSEPISAEDEAALTILESSARSGCARQSIPPAKNSLELALSKRRMAFLRLFSTICPLERSGVEMIARDNVEKIDTALDALFDAQSSVSFLRR